MPRKRNRKQTRKGARKGTRKRNSFGKPFGKPFGQRRYATTWPAGTSRHNSRIPLPGWGAFSASPGLNRAGNAIPCHESADWLFTDRTPPNFPLRFGRRPRKGARKGARKGVRKGQPRKGQPERMRRSSKGTRKGGRRKRQNFGKLPRSVSLGQYTRRGETGFDQVPRSIYRPDGGTVFTRSRSPYTGARVSGLLPRPYGPRDTAALKGYANAKPNVVDNYGTYAKRAFPNRYGRPKRKRRTTKRPKRRRRKKRSEFGDHGSYGPFVNQAYFGQSDFGDHDFGDLEYGPFINQAYFGNAPLAKSIGYRNAKPLFRPHYLKNWNPGYNSYANEVLYLKGWNPYQNRTARTGTQKRTARGARRVSRATALNGAFGLSTNAYAPNNVAYENPFLMYRGAGGNTLNFLTGRNYLKPCNTSMGRLPGGSYLKVKKNNNPTGFLSSNEVVPVSGTRFGTRTGKWSNPDKPWVSNVDEVGRPYPTGGQNAYDSRTGYTRIGQPLELYTYQNTPYGGDKYPEFLGPRSWMGGYGRRRRRRNSRKKPTRSKAKTQPRTTRAKARARPRAQRRKPKVNVKPGDVIRVKSGKLKLEKKGK